MTIDCSYVLYEPQFKPTKAVDRAAAYDIRAYITDPLQDEDIAQIKDYAFKHWAEVYIDGQHYKHPIRDLTLEAFSTGSKATILFPTQRKIVSAGFEVLLSTAQAGATAAMLVCARSGLACKHGILVANAPGIVDENYPLTVGVGLYNTSQHIHVFTHGARIAQVMFIESLEPTETIVTKLQNNGERIGGFGSTGV
jgi:dUTP pyrophosphatase